MGCDHILDGEGNVIGHLCRPTIAEFRVYLRKPGHRKWEMQARKFKKTHTAIRYLHKQFVDGNYKRGIVVGFPPMWCYQEPVEVYGLKRERPAN